MSAAVALFGWATAGGGLACAAGLRRTLQRRTELVARACHEVRGPLTAARLGLHGAPPSLDDGAARLQAVERELGRAGLALDDLAAAGRGRRVSGRVEPVDLVELVSELARAWRPIARARGGDLHLHTPPAAVCVRGERERLVQACRNLVSNAVEHGGGEITVRVRACAPRVRVEVIDRGPGLPASLQALSRTRRRRAGPRPRGRGLAIAADVATRHGGRLIGGPSAGGAHVALELPCAQERCAAPGVVQA